ncbi:putative ribonuclease H-like domain-containing protein [Tanacetum coccineum]|uniref:Ribonuclease H-like domain-containing protein n=1 Tax=Tanacetum coccineum TaxID=301880 RepID=A0ABQ5HNZ9_9ASTR
MTTGLPILNPGDYDLWLIRIEQYFLTTNYSLWEVIKNGNKVLRRTVGTVKQVYEPTTAEEKQDRRNEMKARATLLMALPNKDQLISRCKVSNGSYREKIWREQGVQKALTKQMILLMELVLFIILLILKDMIGATKLKKQHHKPCNDGNLHPLEALLSSTTKHKASPSSRKFFVTLTDKSGSDKGYHSVPPPLTGNFIPRKPDLTFIDEIVESENLDVTTVITPCNVKTVEDKGVSNTVESNVDRRNNTSALIIEDWNSDDESEIDYTIRPNTEKIKSVKTVRETEGNPQQKEYKEKAVIDSGCSRHMIGNKCYLDEYEDYDGGIVSVGDGKGRISDLTYLIAKATIDESNTWHRRLGHINFKTMNKLVKGNLVKGLPPKIFENDHSCVACHKGKQHKASCKTKLVNSISKPLHMLHNVLGIRFGVTKDETMGFKQPS